MQNWNFYKIFRFEPHSVGISGFFCHPDFTWNQFWIVLKLPYFAILGAMNFINMVGFSLQKMQKFMKNKKNSSAELLNVLKYLHFSTLFSCKIWVTEKFCNFHTVYQAIEFDKPERWNTYLTLLCLCTYISWNLCWVALRESAILNMIFLFT